MGRGRTFFFKLSEWEKPLLEFYEKMKILFYQKAEKMKLLVL